MAITTSRCVLSSVPSMERWAPCAWLLEPYEDMAASSGLNTASVESIRETARLALQHDYQLCVHAIGDRANRETLNIFEEAFASKPSNESRRWRVEHAQHLHPDDIPRFAKLGVIASMQGIHCTSDAPFVIPRLGHRRAEQAHTSGGVCSSPAPWSRTAPTCRSKM